MKKFIDSLPWLVPSVAILVAASGYFDRQQPVQEAAPAPAATPAPVAVVATAQPETAPVAEQPIAVEVTRNASVTPTFAPVAATPEAPTPQAVTPASVAVSPTENAAAFFGTAQARLAQQSSCVEDLKSLAAQARVYFPSGGLSGAATGIEQARLIGLVAQNCPGVTIQVEGHSDPSGDPRVNMQLSQQRAEAIVARLRAANIDTSRFVAQGFGSQRPSTVTGPESRAFYDRRVEFSIIETTPRQVAFTPAAPAATQWRLSACAADLQRAVSETNVFFAPGSITVSPADMEAVYGLANKAAACPQARLRVIGQHSDLPGSGETAATGRLRAVAMMTTLVGNGVNSDEIIIAAPSWSETVAGQSASRIDFDVILEDS